MEKNDPIFRMCDESRRGFYIDLFSHESISANYTKIS